MTVEESSLPAREWNQNTTKCLERAALCDLRSLSHLRKSLSLDFEDSLVLQQLDIWDMYYWCRWEASNFLER